MSTEAPLLEVESISKGFPGVKALQDVNLNLYPGEVLAVIGENGAGKSTLMKILAGVQQPDAGAIKIRGSQVQIDSVRKAASLGISLIHQELNLSDNLDVGANIFLGREPKRFGVIDKNKIRRDSEKLLRAVGLDCSPDILVQHLSIGFQQLVEIAKALSINARILIMDEPTSSLSQKESEKLFQVVRELSAKGVAIVYISHRLGEVKELADRVTVLRDGKNAGTLMRSEINHESMVKLMVGRDISQFYQRSKHTPGKCLLEVKDIQTQTYPAKKVSFSISEREIVGIAGLVGAGRSELLHAIFGIDPMLGGSVTVEARRLEKHSPLDAIDAGLGLVPEDRKQHGLVLEMNVRENTSLASLRRDQRFGMVRQDAENQICSKSITELKIKTPNAETLAQLLSGGNQQKIVLGKWLALNPKVLLLDEPTRGIDVGAKREIYKIMDELAAKGMAIVFVSSELEEIIGMSDRALVMHEGGIQGELSRDQLKEESIMKLATGSN